MFVFRISWTLNRNHPRCFQYTSQYGDFEQSVFRNSGQFTRKGRGHQHGVNQAAWMPCNEQQAAFRREVFIVYDVNFPEPNIGEETIESAYDAVR